MAYGRQMTGEGPYYRERKKGQVQCKECGEDMALGSMAGHMRLQNGRVAEGRQSWLAIPLIKELRTYHMAFLTM